MRAIIGAKLRRRGRAAQPEALRDPRQPVPGAASGCRQRGHGRRSGSTALLVDGPGRNGSAQEFAAGEHHVFLVVTLFLYPLSSIPIPLFLYSGRRESLLPGPLRESRGLPDNLCVTVRDCLNAGEINSWLAALSQKRLASIVIARYQENPHWAEEAQLDLESRLRQWSVHHGSMS